MEEDQGSLLPGKVSGGKCAHNRVDRGRANGVC